MYLRRRTTLVLALATLLFLTALYRTPRAEQASARPGTRPGATIAKVSIAVNSLANDKSIARCLRSHAVHNSLHGYQHHIHTTALVDEPRDLLDRPAGVWTKPAYLLHVLLSELVKPKEERVKWLFWVDADTLILNPHIRLETFLPPAEDRMPTSKIHLLLAENWDGINAGVFLLRVHPWSLSLLNAHLAFSTYHPDDWLPLLEQSALSYVLHAMPQFRGNWTSVPHRWFNAFPVNGTYSVDVHQKPMRPDMLNDGKRHGGDSPWKVVKGDMLVHFAGFSRNRETWIPPWADRAEMYLPEWSSPEYQEALEMEVQQFWDRWIREHQSKFPTPEDERVKLRDRAIQWLKKYDEKLIKISDLETLEIRRD